MVTKRPWLPLYVADYLLDTQHLSITESGAYLHLLMAYWVYGGLHANAHALACICKCKIEEWKAIEPVLMPFFEVTATNWIHHRLERELEKTKRISTVRKQAAYNRHSKSAASDDADGGANHDANDDARDDANQDAIAHASAHTLHTSHLRKKDSPPTPPRGGIRGGGGGGLDLQNGHGSKPVPEGDDRAELFTLGRRLLGKDADPLLNRLLRSKGSVAEALRVVHSAQGAKNAHSYIAAAAIRGPPVAAEKKSDDAAINQHDPRL